MGRQELIETAEDVLAEVAGPAFEPAPDRERTSRRHLRRSLVRLAVLGASDVAALVLAREAVRAVRRGWLGEAAAAGLGAAAPPGSIPGPQLIVAIAMSLIVAGCYRAGDRWREPSRVLLATALGTTLAFYSELWGASPGAAAARAIATFVVLGLFLAVLRIAVQAAVQRLPSTGLDHLVLVLRGADARHVPDLGLRYRKIVELDADRFERGTLERWIGRGVDTVVITGRIPTLVLERLLDDSLSHGLRLLTLPREPRTGAAPRRVMLHGHPFLDLSTPELRASQMVLKRALDLALSVLLIVALSPVLLGVAIAVRVSSPGPVLFAQERLGRGGRRFRCLKFRSMLPDAEERLRRDPELHEQYVRNDFKLPAEIDPRITPIGRFLRRSSLDELPQLFNVLRGEMSLVGPRPIVPDELRHYGADWRLFLSLKPGITGWWAVTGRSDVGYPERAYIEVEYIRGWTIFRDLWVLMMTVPAVLFQRGAE